MLLEPLVELANLFLLIRDDLARQRLHLGRFPFLCLDFCDLDPAARFKADTINVGLGQRYDVIGTALRPGKWLIHCHIAHHTTNNNVEMNGGGGLMMLIEVSA